MLISVILACLVVGCLAILSACFHWVRTQRFGTAGAVLSAVGLILIGMSVWASVEARAPRAEIKPPDNTALQHLIEDGNARTLAAVKEADKQLDAKVQELAQKTHEEQERLLSEVQSQILAIRTALASGASGATAATRQHLFGNSQTADHKGAIVPQACTSRSAIATRAQLGGGPI